MELADKSSEKYRKYWLNELNPAEHEALEQRYFDENEVFESVLAAKQQLISDYCRQALPLATQKSFESYFLSSSAHQVEVKLYQAFLAFEAKSGVPESGKVQTATRVEPARRNSWWASLMLEPAIGAWGRWGIACGAIALLAGMSGWFYVRVTTRPAEPTPAVTVAQSSETKLGKQEYLLALSPEVPDAGTRGNQQGAATARAVLSRAFGFVRLRLATASLEGSKCHVEVKSLDTKQVVWQSDISISSKQESSEIRIARELLPTAAYRVTIYKGEQAVPAAELARYRFEVLNSQ
jgi:hypothetical protein